MQLFMIRLIVIEGMHLTRKALLQDFIFKVSKITIYADKLVLMQIPFKPLFNVLF